MNILDFSYTFVNPLVDRDVTMKYKWHLCVLLVNNEREQDSLFGCFNIERVWKYK